MAQFNCLIPRPSNYHIHFWTVFNTSGRGIMGSSQISLISVGIMCFQSRVWSPTPGMCRTIERTSKRALGAGTWAEWPAHGRDAPPHLRRRPAGTGRCWGWFSPRRHNPQWVVQLELVRTERIGLHSEVTSPSPLRFPQMLQYLTSVYFSVHPWKVNIYFYMITVTFSHLTKFIIIS